MTDALSDVMRSVRLKGGVFLDARFTAPWAVNSYVKAQDCKPILAKPAQMIAYHFLIEGRMLVSVEGESATEVRSGYESEEAFSRAFKREVGAPPRSWREQQVLN